MPPRNELVARLMAVSVACREALEQEDWNAISDLLATRGELIERLADMPLSKRDLEVVRHVDKLGSEIAISMAHLLADGRRKQRSDRAAIKMARKYDAYVEGTAYELTG